MLHYGLLTLCAIAGGTYAIRFNILMDGMQIARSISSKRLQAMRSMSRISRA